MVQSPKQRNFTFYRNAAWSRKIIAWILLFLTAAQPILVSAEVIADSKAPVQNRPAVEASASNIPVVQITAPSAAGVSRNFYQQFNVDSQGLILNNSRVVTQTQLAGYITGNPNLANGSARIILNEVTSNNPSYLRGYTEVAGQKAEVIIANPNGIYGDGFGFINTSRAILTTGTPVFGGSGSLEAFRVTGGQIAIQGAGMNAANVDQVDLISRAVSVNAGVWAKKINVIAGSNTVDHNTLKTETISSSDENKPEVAIDVGQLGGMYAQKIYLVGTEKGVGVNSQGTITAQAGDITLTSAGKIQLAGKTSAAGNVQVTAEDDVTNKNTLYAQGNTSITTQGALENSGTIAAGQHTALHAQQITSTGTLSAGVQSDGTVSIGDLAIQADGTLSVSGQNIVAGNLAISGGDIALVNSKTYAGGDVRLSSAAGDINHSSGTMHVGAAETTNRKGVARNFDKSGGFEQTLKDFEGLSLTNVKPIQTQYGPGKVGTLSDGSTIIARPGSKTDGPTLEVQVSNTKVYKFRY